MESERRQKALDMARALESRGETDAAAQGYVGAGEIDEAVRVLVAAGQFIAAGQTLLTALEITVPTEASALDGSGKRTALKAAACFAKGGDTKTAVELLLALEEDARAVELLNRVGDAAGAARVLALQRRKAHGGTPAPARPRTGPMMVTEESIESAQRLEATGALKEAMEVYVKLKRFTDAGRLARSLKLPALAGEFFAKAAMNYHAAVCYIEAGNPGLALEHFSRVPRDDRFYRKACVKAIDVATSLGVLDFSLEHSLSKFVASEPENDAEMAAFYALADLYRRHDFPDNAREALSKVLTRDPTYRDAAMRLVALENEIHDSPAVYQKIMKDDLAFRKQAERIIPVPAPAPTENPAPAHEAPAPQNLQAERKPEAKGIQLLQPGLRIGERYQLGQKLGQGGMGVVFQATDLELSEPIAMKFITAELGDARMLARFKREVSLARKLTHPNIVRVHDMGIHEGLRYITMELLHGQDLRQKMGSPMSFAAALGYLVQTCQGLGYAHERGIIHRDVKPENLFITDDDVVKLMDFGIAKRQAATGVTTTGIVVGTPEYMSPEQINDFSAVSPASDLYAVGVVAYQMFTGTVPFRHEELMALLIMHLRKVPDPPREKNPQIPEALEAAILRMLEKEPARRFASCNEAAEHLTQLKKQLERG